ncbi:MAG: hypothetical protein CBB68_09885 [Rhodospirillaceae bacterium TMED8]|nr:hypothetical protein [Magnetovibrio sp.]OUT50166.1 MAG: hypothetical protein CBB68_09885 [Rhodospirillaceae bacterium TMED8]
MLSNEQSRGSYLGWTKGALCVLLVSAISLEVFSAIVIELHLIPADSPNYKTPGERPFWVDRNPHFGMWHEAETEYIHTKSCFSVTYRTNTFGARDRQRDKMGNLPRVLMLGDSFTEGYGLKREDRTSDILESQTKVEHLNFGTSGHFGPTQYWLLYKHLGLKFNHNLVIINLLPDNDFVDDDPNHAAIYQGQYRPYLERTGARYLLTYINRDQKGASKKEIRREKRRYFGRMLRNFTYSINAINYIMSFMRQIRPLNREQHLISPAFSGYFDFSRDQAERLIEVMSRVMVEAEARQVIVTVTPRPADLIYMNPSPLIELLMVVAEDYPNLHIIDFRKAFQVQPNWHSFYRDCDGHWSPAGAKAAANILLQDEVYRRTLGIN